MRSLVVGLALLAVACGQTPPADRHDDVTAQGVNIQDVHITTTEAGFTVQYRTQTSSRDCAAQAAEMPKVWDQVVKPRLKDPSVQRVVLFPEDTSLWSVAYTFTRSESGQWTAVAPCTFSIPGTSREIP